MTLTEQLTDYVNAAFSGLWVLTHEPDEAERDLVQHALSQQWQVAVWDVVQRSELATAPSTLVGVASLGYSGQLVEIEAVAVIDESGGKGS